MDNTREQIKSLINKICDFDRVFKQCHKNLSSIAIDVVNKDGFAIQKFKDTLHIIKNKIDDITTDAINIRNELAIDCDNLIRSLHATENKLEQLEEKKLSFQIRRETLEKELIQKQKQVDTYKTLFWAIPFLAIILSSINAFDSFLQETKTQLNFIQQEMGWLSIEKNYNQQELEKLMIVWAANHHLTNCCDNLQNNIKNIHISLK